MDTKQVTLTENVYHNVDSAMPVPEGPAHFVKNDPKFRIISNFRRLRISYWPSQNVQQILPNEQKLMFFGQHRLDLSVKFRHFRQMTNYFSRGNAGARWPALIPGKDRATKNAAMGHLSCRPTEFNFRAIRLQ